MPGKSPGVGGAAPTTESEMLKKVPMDVRVFAHVVDDLPVNVIFCDR